MALFEVKCGVRPSFMYSLKSMLLSNVNCVNRPALSAHQLTLPSWFLRVCAMLFRCALVLECRQALGSHCGEG